MTTQMQALVYEGPRTMVVRELPVPTPADDEVLIRVRYSGICGSELSGYLGQNALRTPPQIFGHEFAGEIVARGARVSSVLPLGALATANPLVTCGTCARCRAGDQQLCVSRRLLSAALPGSNAEYVTIPARNVHLLGPTLDLRAGALTEPVACAARVLALAAPRSTDVALVVGLGPIGLLVAQALRLGGVRQIIGVDTNTTRCAVGADLGFVVAADTATGVALAHEHSEAGADLAVDAVGVTATRLACITGVRPGGTVVFTGLHSAESQLPVNTIVRSEIRCHGAFAYRDQDFATALAWLRAGVIGLEAGVIVAPLAAGGAWFARLVDGQEPVTKVLLTPEAR